MENNSTHPPLPPPQAGGNEERTPPTPPKPSVKGNEELTISKASVEGNGYQPYQRLLASVAAMVTIYLIVRLVLNYAVGEQAKELIDFGTTAIIFVSGLGGGYVALKTYREMKRPPLTPPQAGGNEG